jgi:hypothetical protein
MTGKTPPDSKVCGPSGYYKNKNGCTDLLNLLRAQDRFTNAAVAGYIVGGVAAVGTVALLFMNKPRQQQRTGIVVVPMLGNERGGISVSGTF